MPSGAEDERSRDRELGLDRRITRRDFLDGVAVGAGAIVAGGWLAGCSSGRDDGPAPPASTTATRRTPSLPPYPPELTGMRGEIDSAYAIPHMLRDGTFWASAGSPENTGETYDLVVVGGGISGLAAAYFYRQRDPGARILILDNHDDIGGHARRNEFTDVAGRPGGRLISYGGTESIAAPSAYSATSMGLLRDLGIHLERFHGYYNSRFWRGLGQYSFFDRETWGRDHLAVARGKEAPAEYLRGAPLAARAVRELDMLHTHPGDWLPGRSDGQKKAELATMTYAEFLTKVAKVHPDVVRFLSTRSSPDWGYGIDGLGAIDAWASDYPGFGGLGLSSAKPSRYNSPTTRHEWNATDPYIFHFPGGNAAIARLLVRRLVPGSLPGSTMEDEVLARLDYGRLDRAENFVRIRLGSPVVRVRNLGDPTTAAEAEVAYVQSGRLRSVRAKGAIVACWYSMVPYIVDGLPTAQREAAGFMTRIPLVAATVQLRTRTAFERLAIGGGAAVSPGAEWVASWLDYPVSMGGYEYPIDLAEPGILILYSTPTTPGVPPRQGAVEGRRRLYGTPFAGYERSIRDHTARVLSGGGFDPARDIQAITLNRWAHGYSFEYVTPWDLDFYPDGPLPGEVAARPFGRITFANTDRTSRAYTDSAIDAAYSAVGELVRR